MILNTHSLSSMLCEKEAKKEQVNIAQMNEIFSILPEILRQFTPNDVLDWVFGKKGWKFQVNITSIGLKR
jgi:hypothetical protein